MAAVLSGLSGLAQAQERTPQQHRKASIRTFHTDGTAEAYNWSGYAIAASTSPATETSPTGVRVTSVSGSWVVPKATCTGRSTQYAAFWIGIDGWYSPTVEQIGTDSDCSSGTPQYYAWYEFYPLDSFYACPASTGRRQAACPLKDLNPGDTMTASVVYNASNGTFTASIEDVTKGSSTTFTTIYTPNRETGAAQLSSAEWIAEAPCCTNSGGTLPLSDFGTVAFQNADAVVNGSALSPIGSFYNDTPATWWACTMVIQSYSIPDGGVNPTPPPPPNDIMAEPGVLLNNGSAFDVVFQSSGP